MGLRDIIEANKLAIGIIVLVLLLVIGSQMIGSKSKAASAPRWYYDLDTNELVPHATFETAPITLPNGHSAVLAHVYGCGNCDGDTFIAFIERFDPSAPNRPNPNAKVESNPNAADSSQGRQIAADPKTTGGKPLWIAHDSPQAATIGGGASPCSQGQRSRQCRPD